MGVSMADVGIGEWIRRCRLCAGAIYDTRAPSPAYAERVARQLFLTGAHESGFAVRRQRQRDGTLFPHESTAGAFSVFQMEAPGIRAGIAQLKSRPGLKHHVDQWLLDNDSLTIPVEGSEEAYRFVLRELQRPEGDFWALVLARLYYLRVPAAIPAGTETQAAYAKRYWNTEAGKATPMDYAACTADLLWTITN